MIEDYDIELVMDENENEMNVYISTSQVLDAVKPHSKVSAARLPYGKAEPEQENGA